MTSRKCWSQICIHLESKVYFGCALRLACSRILWCLWFLLPTYKFCKVIAKCCILDTVQLAYGSHRRSCNCTYSLLPPFLVSILTHFCTNAMHTRTHTHTLTHSVFVVGFSPASYFVDEVSGVVIVTVLRQYGTLAGSITLLLTTQDGTAEGSSQTQKTVSFYLDGGGGGGGIILSINVSRKLLQIISLLYGNMLCLARVFATYIQTKVWHC